MSTPRGTTPTFIMTFTEDGLDFTLCNNVYVTFKTRSAEVTKTGGDIGITAKTIEVFLSQAETLKFVNYDTNDDVSVEVQVNWTYTTGVRGASKIRKVIFSKQLLDRVVE